MKTILITGANRGLGLQFCRHYLEDGFKVLACCRSPATADELAALNDGDRLIELLSLDLLSEPSIEHLGESLQKRNVHVDLMINNAGVSVEAEFGKWTQAALAENFGVNSIGSSLVTQAIYPLLSEQAKVIFISSGLGSIGENINPSGPFEPYSMSKAALSVVCRRLATKSLDRRVYFAAISPGWVRTDMGGPEAPTDVVTAVTDMASVIEQLDASKNGKFLDSNGDEIPW